MKHLVLLTIICLLLNGCQQKEHNTIAVNGSIKNAHHNKISLMSFGATNTPIILDTCTLDINGKYQLKSLVNNEELYALKVDSFPEIWFVNDTKEITINIDLKEYKSYKTIGSKASEAIHSFISKLDSLFKLQKKLDSNIDTLIKQKAKDSLINISKEERKTIKNEIKNFCTSSIAGTNNAALKYFFLFFTHKTKALEETETYRMITAAQKQFPKNEQLAFLYSTLSSVVKANPKLFLINEPAFDFELIDTTINKITLKAFTGKYLLMNFYETNSKANVQQSTQITDLYNQYKQKRFEILNISFDSTKPAWKKSIKYDSTGWRNTIDTLRFNSKIAKNYYITSLPYNVLINPTGKIIAIDLSEDELQSKLKELLK